MLQWTWGCIYLFILVCTFFWINTQKWKCYITILHGSSINFLRHLYTVFHSGCTNLLSHQKCTRISFFPHPCQHLLFVCIFNNSHSNRCQMVIVLICISLKINNVEHLFIYLLAMSSLEKYLFSSSAHLLIRLSFFFFAIEFYEFFIYLRYNSLRYMICKYFPPFRYSPFHLVDDYFCSSEVYLVWCIPTCLLVEGGVAYQGPAPVGSRDSLGRTALVKRIAKQRD